jgi:hypothetical protein
MLTKEIIVAAISAVCSFFSGLLFLSGHDWMLVSKILLLLSAIGVGFTLYSIWRKINT